MKAFPILLSGWRSRRPLAALWLNGVGALALLAAFASNLVAAPEVTTLTGGPFQGNPSFFGYADGNTADVAQFHTPVGLALDTFGNTLFVADRDNNAIRALDLGGNLTFTFTTNQIIKPVGVALNGAGHLYVLNRGSNGNNGTLLEFDSFGDLLAKTVEPLTNANGIALDSIGNIYVTVQSNTVKRITPSSSGFLTNITTIATITTANTLLRGITVTSSGNLAVCDSGNHGILLISPSTGTVTTNTGFRGRGDRFGTKGSAQFDQPYGVAAAAAGVLVVTDYGNNRVKVVDALGTVTNLYGVSSNFWVTGPGTFPGWWDGTVSRGDANYNILGTVEARLPAGVIFANGDVYTTEDYYHLIRKVTSTGLPLPPPPLPAVPDPQIGWVDFTVPPATIVSVLRPGSSFVFNNDVIIAIAGTAGAETHYTFGLTPVGVDTIPDPSPTTGSTPPTYRDGMFYSQVPPSIVLPQPDVTIKAVSFQSDRPSSAIVSSRFQFRTASPVITGNNAASFTVSDLTTNAQMWYTIDGTDPTNGAPSVGPLLSPANISLNIATNTTFKIRAFRDNYQPSEVVSQTFSATNFNANKISFGFASGEASSDFIASPGQFFYAPITLSILPDTKIYSLQFNVTVTNAGPNPGPAVTPGAVGFESALEKPIPGITPVVFERIPPLSFAAYHADPPPASSIRQYDGQPFVDMTFVNTNNNLNLLGVGWLERFTKTNLYDTTKQDLIKYSQPHDTLFDEDDGKVVLGGYAFQVPTNAQPGQTYRIQIGLPSATSDGIGAPGSDVYIATPTNGSLVGGVINSIKHVTVSQRKYLAGDSAPFRWFNAGDFGNTNLDNSDVMQVFQSAIYTVNMPPFGSDFFDAMDSCGDTYVVNPNGYLVGAGAYVTNNLAFVNGLFNGSDININQLAFGDGKLDVCDVYVTFRRSLDPSLVQFRRFWTTDGVRGAEIPGAVPPPPVILPAAAGAASVSFATADFTASAGQTVQVPVTANVSGAYPLRTLMLNLSVVPLDGSPALTSSVQFAPNPALGLPTITSSEGNANYAATWLNNTIAGLSGNATIGTLTVQIPAGAPSSAAYAVHFDHASASPNGLAAFSKQTRTGLITRADRSASSWNDGIPDSWRLRYFGSIYNLLSAATGDADGDTANNWAEYKAGTDPNDRNSVLRLSSSKAPGSNQPFVVRWPSVLGKSYVIEQSAALFGGAWIPVSTNNGTGSDMQFQDSDMGGNRFYRVRVAE